MEAKARPGPSKAKLRGTTEKARPKSKISTEQRKVPKAPSQVHRQELQERSKRAASWNQAEPRTEEARRAAYEWQDYKDYKDKDYKDYKDKDYKDYKDYKDKDYKSYKDKDYKSYKSNGWVEQRQLPIQAKRAEVVEALRAPVLCLLGETGSGKSTQVPQIILEEARAAQQEVRVCVTQPRRVAALNLAKRVASELGEAVGSTVGYRIGGESWPGENIDFCTVGYALQLFLNAPEEFGHYTHIVLDEVHERSAESDMLCLVVRLLTQFRFQSTRLVVMSATLQSQLFAKYFSQVSAACEVFVGARCFKVQEHFLEELPKALGHMRTEQTILSRIKDVFGVKGKKIDQKHCDKMHGIIIEALELIARPDSTILVFLPGIAEISSLWQEARALEGRGFRIFPLHSMVPREEQELVFQEPVGVTNVVLATDIAESSITLPHVVAVLDLGLHRRMDHDAKGIASLATKWISKAAATQRSGRAGRTQPGLCLRFYTKEFFTSQMKDFEPPESTSMSLDRLYLQAKQLSVQLLKSLQGTGAPRSAQDLLAQLPEAPNLKNVEAARQKNAELGAISEASEAAQITALGYLCLQLPLDLRQTRLIWLGAHFGVVADAVLLASVMSSQDAFSMPSPLFMREEPVFVQRLRAAASARLLFDGGELSEPLMHRQLFLEWLAEFHQKQYVYGDKDRVLWARRRHTTDFCEVYSLSKGRMDHVVSSVVDLSLRTYRACMPNSVAQNALRELLFGLGYTVNQKGDLAGIAWKDWRRFQQDVKAFHSDPGYLKALMASSFSDHLLIGGYGVAKKELEANGRSARKHFEQIEALQSLMEKHQLPPRETVMFVKDALEDPGAYVEFVCGSRPHAVIEEETHTLVALGLDPSMEAQRWQPLVSRPEAPLLASRTRLPAEFNLLAQFEKHMRELQRVQASGWSYKPISFLHPHLLKWEWMEPLYTAKGLPLRCEGMLERKNAVGLIGYIQPLEKGHLKPVASFAVAANVRGGQGPTNSYPESVTCLSPGHIAFVLVTAKLESTKNNLRRFGFTTNGELAVLHRCVHLPDGSLYGEVWEKVRRLREELAAELQFEMPTKDTPVLYDSQVSTLAWDLYEASKLRKGEEATLSLDRDGVLSFLSNSTVNLLKDEVNHTHKAFLPVAEWSTLVQRRQTLLEKINSRVAKAARSRSRTRRRARLRSRSRKRSRSRRREEKPRKEVTALSLYDLVLQVLERWRTACQDEVGDERFRRAIDKVLRARVLTRREVDQVESSLRRRLPVRPRGPRSGAVELRVPRALAELERRNESMERNLRIASPLLRSEMEVLRRCVQREPPAARQPAAREPAAREREPAAREREPAAREPMAREPAAREPAQPRSQPPVAEPAVEEPPDEPLDEPPDEPPDEPLDEPAEEATGEPLDVAESSPDEIPGLAPFTPSPEEEAGPMGVSVAGFPGWVKCVDDEGNEFFYNKDSGESSWEPPS